MAEDYQNDLLEEDKKQSRNVVRWHYSNGRIVATSLWAAELPFSDGGELRTNSIIYSPAYPVGVSEKLSWNMELYCQEECRDNTVGFTSFLKINFLEFEKFEYYRFKVAVYNFKSRTEDSSHDNIFLHNMFLMNIIFKDYG